MTPNELQKLLVNQREKLGLTQQEVVEKSEANITRQYYGMIENGERRPSVSVAKKLSAGLGLDWTIFFELNSNEKLLKSNSA